MQPQGRTAQPALPPAPNCSSCGGTFSSSWSHLCGRKRSRAPAALKASPHALLIVDLLVPALCEGGTTAPHRSRHHSHLWWHRCRQLCPGDSPLGPLALPSSKSPANPSTPSRQPPATERQGSPRGLQLLGRGCIRHPSVARSQQGRARSSSYPISSALSEEKKKKSTKSYKISLLRFPPARLLLQ